MDKYAASWHIQWLKGTLNGIHPKSMTGYINPLRLRFDDQDAKDEAYADLEKVQYEGCIKDMFTKMQVYNDKASVSGAVLKKLILVRLPQKIIEQMHTVDLTGKSDQEIIDIITNAGRTAEKWESVKKNLGIKMSSKSHEKTKRKHKRSDKKERRFKNNCKKKSFKKKKQSSKTYKETEGIESSELERR